MGEWEWKFIQMSWVTWPTWLPLYEKKLWKSSSLELMDWWPWNMVCSIRYSSTTKIVHLMTLGWPWPFLQQDQMWENANTLDFMESFECFGQNMVIKVVLMRQDLWVEEVKVIVWALTQDSCSMTVSNISSKATWPIVTKSHLEPPVVREQKYVQIV